ncbi:MAG TPA: NAD(P)-binding domain-containing protein [Gemmataceae bacterium]|jgi:thioredoxin reductase|nr:NAD(P)-binding domain-containing protein [Gemmataceae bacterium]
MARSDNPRIAVLGAGPIGLEAALYARSLNFPVTIYERGRIGEHLQRWGHVRLFTPFGINSTPLGRVAILEANPRHEFPGDADCLNGRQHVTSYLEPLAKSPRLREAVKTDSHVLYVGKRGLLKEDVPAHSKRPQQPFRLLVREAKSREHTVEADLVLDCTGTYGQHRWMGDGGIPAAGEIAAEAQIAYGLDDILGERRGAYAGKNVLVVGGGYSAATTVCNLAAVAEKDVGTWVIWLARAAVTQPLRRIANDPLRERDRLAVRANMLATRTDGNVEFHAQTVVESIETAGPDKGYRVSGLCAGKRRTWEVDRVIANVGFSPDASLYRELQIEECPASLAPKDVAASLLKHAGTDLLGIPAAKAESLRTSEPGFFILGAKSYGRNSQFFLRAGFDQVRDVFRLITGKDDLDLYKKP